MTSASSVVSVPSLIAYLGRFRTQSPIENPHASLTVEIRSRPAFDLVVPLDGRTYKVVRDAPPVFRSRPNFTALARLHGAVLAALDARKAAAVQASVAASADDSASDEDDMFLGLLSKKPRIA